MVANERAWLKIRTNLRQGCKLIGARLSRSVRPWVDI
jgi:hypothetical protein